MPELPEVETIRRGLEPALSSHRILSVRILTKKLRWEIIPRDFEDYVVNKSITGLSRRGKYIVMHLDNRAAVVIHLGMSGRLCLFEQTEDVEKHTHIIFNLSNRMELRFRDPRRFGSVEVAPPYSIASFPRFAHLGVEPLSSNFNFQYMKKKTENSTRAIKLVLMNAKIVVGIGNIYANESLFYSRIDPCRIARSLSEKEIKKLVKSAKMVLNAAIKKGGTTLNDFRNAYGEPGFFQLELAVYGRADLPCSECGNPIHKTVLGGRSTFFCPNCQK
ncbi:MAG: bifunctional DNA-formamidopyrimidine glycosylase/DNA-(apurinic or apyrimidinic site) lyase [Actinobacteria bacterium]|nr:bifunctional DNA-formamidopyrimidine glycosylase/DNA-(apurinic or apyrimidinic site) lyase [Actinomycetota bacterium]